MLTKLNITIFTLFFTQGMIILFSWLWGLFYDPELLYFPGLIRLGSEPWISAWLGIGHLIPVFYIVFLKYKKADSNKSLVFLSGFLAAEAICCILFYGAGKSILLALMSANLWESTNKPD